MKWVLIIGIYLMGDRGGVGMTSIEFDSQQACEAAGKAMKEEWSRGSFGVRDLTRYVCVRK